MMQWLARVGVVALAIIPTIGLFAPAHAHPRPDHLGAQVHGKGSEDRFHNGGRDGRAFVVTCDFSHTATVDPIVHPGDAQMSHWHTFFGNTTTNENSTGASLLAGGTTCNDPNNKSAYWVPALYQDRVLVEPLRARVSYGRLGGDVSAFPVGFMALSGRTDDTARWGCRFPGQRPYFTSSVTQVPTCKDGALLVAEITFGDCWDGSSLDSADHASHVRAAVDGAGARPTCPATHPVRVPRVRVLVEYPPAARGGSGITLASGDAGTLHADIFEAWVGSSLQDRINR